MIDGVILTPLKQILDERGKIMHMLRVDAPHFIQFGEIYFSVVEPGVVKAWHLHREMTLNYAVPFGKVKVVLYDDRDGSATRGELVEVFLGPDNYQLLTVPPGVWNGFKGLGQVASIVANCATIPHDPDEIVREDPIAAGFPYDWRLRHS